MHFSEPQPSLERGFVMRGLRGDGDLELVAELFNSCAAADPMENSTSVEEVRSDLARPQIDTAQDVVLVESRGSLVGFAALLLLPGRERVYGHVWMQTAPDTAFYIELRIVEWIQSRARAASRRLRLPVEIVVDAGGNRHGRELALNAAGYEIVRHFCRLRRSLADPIDEVRIPSGYSFRAMSSLDEMPRWVEAYNDAFVDHWHFHEKTLAQALQFATEDPNYRRDGDLIVVESDGAIAGFCQCVIRSNENLVRGRREGWISLLGVCQNHRRLGLGSALLRTGLRWLQKEGMTIARLSVDAASPTGATMLYEAAGFEVVERRTCWGAVAD